MPFRAMVFERLHMRDPQLVESSQMLRNMRMEKVNENPPANIVPTEDFAVEECMALYREVLSGDVVIR